MAILLFASCNKPEGNTAGSTAGSPPAVAGRETDQGAAGQSTADESVEEPGIPAAADDSPLLTATYSAPDGSTQAASRFIGTPLVLNFWSEW